MANELLDSFAAEIASNDKPAKSSPTQTMEEEGDNESEANTEQEEINEKIK